MNSLALAVLLLTCASAPPPHRTRPAPASFASARPAELDQKDDIAEFDKRRTTWLVEAGQRHLEYGLELRKQGLALQAAEQIRLAVEVSEDKNPGAGFVLRLMQNLDDKFWKKNLPKPSAPKLDAYVKQARKLETEDQKNELALAAWATSRHLEREARTEYRAILKRRGEALEFDAKGALVLEGGTIPSKDAAFLREEAILINGRLYLRDAFLALAPEIKSIFEKADEVLRVRSTRALAEAERLHAIGIQLLPVLERDLGAKPTHALTVVLVDTREAYELWLVSAGLADNKALPGVASPKHQVAVICTHDMSDDFLLGTFLHELTHVFDQAVARSRLPSFYREGLAETYGGEGTFELVAGKLTTGRMLALALLKPVVGDGLIPLRDLIETSGIAAYTRDPALGQRFYAESWAFLRYLRTAAGDDVRERFETWETVIRGSMLGVEIGKTNDPKGAEDPAGTLFLQFFAKDLHMIEDGFAQWLEATAGS